MVHFIKAIVGDVYCTWRLWPGNVIGTTRDASKSHAGSNRRSLHDYCSLEGELIAGCYQCGAKRGRQGVHQASLSTSARANWHHQAFSSFSSSSSSSYFSNVHKLKPVGIGNSAAIAVVSVILDKQAARSQWSQFNAILYVRGLRNGNSWLLQRTDEGRWVVARDKWLPRAGVSQEEEDRRLC